MEYNLQDFILELNAIIPEIEQELANRKMGIAGDGTVEQLILFLDELKKYKVWLFRIIYRLKRKGIRRLLVYY